MRGRSVIVLAAAFAGIGVGIIGGWWRLRRGWSREAPGDDDDAAEGGETRNLCRAGA